MRSLPIRGIPVTVALEKILEFSRSLRLGSAALRLDSAVELITHSGSFKQPAMSQPAPEHFYVARELQPDTAPIILIHIDPLLLSKRHVEEASRSCAPVLNSVRHPSVSTGGTQCFHHALPDSVCLCVNAHSAHRMPAEMDCAEPGQRHGVRLWRSAVWNRCTRRYVRWCAVLCMADCCSKAKKPQRKWARRWLK